MKKMLLVIAIFAMLFMTGCTSKKEFSESGITITLDSSFSQKDATINFPLLVESLNYVVTGLREEKSRASAEGVKNLNEYINLVIKNNKKTGSPVEEYKIGDKTVYYFDYTATIDGRDFSYRLFVFEGEKHYYSMNFASLTNKFEKAQSKFNSWAETVVVE